MVENCLTRDTNKEGKTVYHINYLGKQYNTTIYKEITDEEFKEIGDYYFSKPSFELVKKQFLELYCGGSSINYIDRYYFREVWSNVRLYHSKWSIKEALQCKPIVEVFVGKVQENKEVYPDDFTLPEKVEIAFRICGLGVASKPSNFPYSEIDKILDKYNVNNVYYDFSCGWGVRLLGALVHKINYYGTDPNHVLVDRLNLMVHDFKDIFGDNSEAKIYCQGSEVLIPELVGKVGLAFSSPPYFNLEDYRIGENQSYKEGTNYKDWVLKYYYPTMRNIYQYLVDDGYFMLNIKNFGKHHLEEDTVKIAQYCKFKYEGTIKLNNIVRRVQDGTGQLKDVDNSENIFVFKKH